MKEKIRSAKGQTPDFFLLCDGDLSLSYMSEISFGTLKYFRHCSIRCKLWYLNCGYTFRRDHRHKCGEEGEVSV